ncbi:FHA domain-containing protein [Thalassotalea euphylliae]|uniref:FHA domain-containing protein n=1 Tax=Thalassotalea euphylliae TaxID=1655234 RepID=UPI0036458976
MEIIIEEISKGHKLIGRHKYHQSSVNVGRAYSNDVILTDPHICPEHLKIEEIDGQWRVHDLGSLNGSFLDNGKQSADGHIIHSGDVINIGNSQIRILFPNHPVPSSVPFSPFETLINLARNPLIIGSSVLLFTLISAWLTYLDSGKEVSFIQLLVPAIGMTLLFGIWPAMVSLVSHLTKNDARIMHQIGLSFVFYLVLMSTDAVQALLKFNTSSNLPIGAMSNVLPIMVAFCLFWLNCYVGFHMSSLRRGITAVLLTGLFFGGTALVQISKQPDFNPRPQYDATLLPPAYQLSGASDVDTFISDSEKLFEKTRELAEKSNKEKG